MTADDHDPFERLSAIEDRWLAVPASHVFPRWVVTAGFGLIGSLLMAILSVVVGISLDTRSAIDRQVVPLQEVVAGQRSTIKDRDARISRLEERLSDAESIQVQQTDAIVLLLDLLEENGVPAPRIRIEPPGD
jgi:hypothetical protein